MPSITPKGDESPKDFWERSLFADDAKYWRQEEVRRINQTGEMNITPIPHTNECEATGWSTTTNKLTLKRQFLPAARRVLFYILDLALLAGVILSLSVLIGAVETMLGVAQ